MLIIKIGGGKDIDTNTICQDLAKLEEPFIVVHGGNHALDELSANLGYEVKELTSPSGFESRYSDKKTMELFTMAYCGLVNKQIVAKLQSLGVNAVGLSGIDGGLWSGKRKKAVLSVVGDREVYVKDNYFMKLERIDHKLLKLLLDNGYVPVLSAPGISDKGEICNLDNDTAVAEMTKHFAETEIVHLIEAPGLLEDPEDENSVIKSIKVDELENLVEKTRGGMKRKIRAIKRSFENGVKKVYIGEGRTKRPVSASLAGEGTVIS